MCLNGTEQLRRAIWCEIYVIRVGYIPYLKKFAKQLDSDEEEISSGTSGPEDRSQLIFAKDSQEGGPVSEEEVRLMDYKLN